MARLYKDSKSYASLVLVHAALKWFPSFIPDDVQNPLDSSICHNFLEAVKHSKSSPVVKKLPVVVGCYSTQSELARHDGRAHVQQLTIFSTIPGMLHASCHT